MAAMVRLSALRFRLVDTLRAALVMACAGALIAAGQIIPL